MIREAFSVFNIEQHIDDVVEAIPENPF